MRSRDEMKAHPRKVKEAKVVQVNMEQLVPEGHLLRKLKAVIDFSCVRKWVDPLYPSTTGRPATDPEVILRLILLSYLFNHSERMLFQELKMHGGFLWFCDLDFESSIPDRTTIVKTRKLWRKHGVFDDIMHHVVDQCITSGLVEANVHAGADGTQVRANVSIHSLREKKLAPVVKLDDYLTKLEQEDGETAEEEKNNEPPSPPADPPDSQRSQTTVSSDAPVQSKASVPPDLCAAPPEASGSSGAVPAKLQEHSVLENFHGQTFSNATHQSTTDPDSRLYKKSKGQEAHPRYLVHDLTDTRSGVILATSASIATGEAEREVTLTLILQTIFRHPTIQIQTLSADKAYGAVTFLMTLFTLGIIPLVSLKDHKLEEEPTWQRKTNNPEHQKARANKVKEVQARNRAKQIQIDGKYSAIQKQRARLEHGYAEAKVAHGMDRTRSRGLACMQEQALCTATVQNLKRLAWYKGKRPQMGTAVNEDSVHSLAKPPIKIGNEETRNEISPFFIVKNYFLCLFRVKLHVICR